MMLVTKSLAQKALAASNKAYVAEFDKLYYDRALTVQQAMEAATKAADEAFEKVWKEGIKT